MCILTKTQKYIYVSLELGLCKQSSLETKQPVQFRNMFLLTVLSNDPPSPGASAVDPDSFLTGASINFCEVNRGASSSTPRRSFMDVRQEYMEKEILRKAEQHQWLKNKEAREIVEHELRVQLIKKQIESYK